MRAVASIGQSKAREAGVWTERIRTVHPNSMAAACVAAVPAERRGNVDTHIANKGIAIEENDPIKAARPSF